MIPRDTLGGQLRLHGNEWQRDNECPVLGRFSLERVFGSSLLISGFPKLLGLLLNLSPRAYGPRKRMKTPFRC
jgi:hypothetical protein